MMIFVVHVLSTSNKSQGYFNSERMQIKSSREETAILWRMVPIFFREMDGSRDTKNLWGRCRSINSNYTIFPLEFFAVVILATTIPWERIDFHQDALHKIIICTHFRINSSTYLVHSFKKNNHTSQRYLCSSGLGPALMHLSQSLGESEFAWRFSHVHWDKLN